MHLLSNGMQPTICADFSHFGHYYWDLNQFSRAVWFTSNYILGEQIALPERSTIYWRQLVPESPIHQYAIPSATATSHSLHSVSPPLRFSQNPPAYLAFPHSIWRILSGFRVSQARTVSEIPWIQSNS